MKLSFFEQIKFLLEEYPECFSLHGVFNTKDTEIKECREISFSNINIKKEVYENKKHSFLYVDINLGSDYSPDLDYLKNNDYGLGFDDGKQKRGFVLYTTSMTVEKKMDNMFLFGASSLLIHKLIYILRCYMLGHYGNFDFDKYQKGYKESIINKRNKERVNSVKTNRFEMMDL